MIKNIIEISALVLVCAAVYFDNRSIKVSKYTIKNNKIPNEFNNFKIVLLSDLHSNSFGKDNIKLIKKIKSENPNIIVMTGDMVNKYDMNFNEFFKLVKDLSKVYKIYYIVGNHEKRLSEDNMNLIIRKLEEFGVTILNDEKAIINERRDVINIYGMDLPLIYYRRKKNESFNIEEFLNKQMKKYTKEEFNILLVHNPLYFDYYSRYNADLILSGHVHGGMIRLPFIGAILSPERKFFPKYNSGAYEKNSRKIIVSKGLGQSKPGIRLFNRPEIVSITLLN